MSDTLVVNSSNRVRVRELRDTDYIIDNSATVTVELRDSSGSLVAGEVWPKTLSSMGSGGVYEVYLDPALSIIVGETYKQTILAVNTANFKQTQFVTYRSAVEYAGCT